MVLQRSRLARLLVAIALVALAAVGLRLSEGRQDRAYESLHQDFETRRGILGEPVAVNGGSITASDVRVGTSLSRRDDVYATTPGLFLVVRVEVAATGTELVRTMDMRLFTRDRRYDSFSHSSTGQAEPGFVASVDGIFEVDPADLADLTLELYPAEVVSGYTQHTWIHLGITPGNAEQWRAAGQNQVVETLDLPSLRAI
jgi:hypothetical protein